MTGMIFSCTKEPMPNNSINIDRQANIEITEPTNVHKALGGVVVRVGIWDGTEENGCPGCKDNGPICYIEVEASAGGHQPGSYLPKPDNGTWYVPNALSNSRYQSGDYTFYEINHPLSSGGAYSTNWTQLLEDLEVN